MPATDYRFLANFRLLFSSIGHHLSVASVSEKNVCYKKSYPEKIDALINLADITRDDGLGRQEKRAYYCYSCKAWHLTSQPN